MEKVQENTDVLEDSDAEGKTIEHDKYPDQDDIKGKELTLHFVHGEWMYLTELQC